MTEAQHTIDTPRERADLLMIRARQAGITERKELAIFMGQAQVETGHFRHLEENMNYSPERLLAVFPGRNGMNTLAEAREIAARDHRGVANAMYGGRWGAEGLGNTEPDDGWNYRGRGYLQVTGRRNYSNARAELEDKFGRDVVRNPEALGEPEFAAAAAVHYWKTRVVSQGHQEDVLEATRAINPRMLHLQERRQAAAEWERKLEEGYEPRLPGGVRGHLPTSRPIDPDSPVRSLFESALSRIEAHENASGIARGPHTTKLAHAVAGQAVYDRLDRIDRVDFNDIGSHARAVQFGTYGDDPLFNRSQPVGIADALAYSTGDSLQRFANTTPLQRDIPKTGVEPDAQRSLPR